jgi:hypothetical protein
MAIATIESASYNLSTVAACNKAVENCLIIHPIFHALQHNNNPIDNGDSTTSSCPPITPMEQAYD